MEGGRSFIAALALVLSLSGSLVFTGCGDSDAPPAVQTDAQKAEALARQKETEDAFKDSKKKKNSTVPHKGGGISNGVRTS